MARVRRKHAEAGPRAGRAPARLRLARGLLPWLVLGLAILLVAVSLALLGLSGRSLPVPHFLVARIETRANAALAGQASVSVGNADMVVSPDFVPQVRLRNVTLMSPAAQQLAIIRDIRISLKAGALLSGQMQPARLFVSGARVALRRRPDGSLDVAIAAKSLSGKPMRPADIVLAVERTFDLPVLSGIEAIDVAGLSILLDDSRSGQVWSVQDGTLTLRQDSGRLTVDVGFGLAGQAILTGPSGSAAAGPGSGPSTLARTHLAIVTDKRSHAAELEVQLSQVSSADLAAQVPAFAWLSALDAPISGRFHSGIAADGKLTPLVAALDLGSGALRPTPDTRPIPFDSAHLGLTYDPATAQLDLSAMRVNSPSLQVAAIGHAWVKGMETGSPDALVGQVQVTDFKADPEGVFDNPVSLSQGALDFKLDLKPFRLTIGQLMLVDRGRHISASGLVGAEPAGWSVALDVAIDDIETSRLLALWPVSAVPNTRKWLHDNVATGELFDVKGALRLRPGQEPKLALGYQFRGAEVRFLKTLPPIVDGAGYATIEDYTYTLVVDKGRVVAPQGGDLDVAGSVVKVPDIREIPARAEISLESRSSLTAALAILDQPPFLFISKAGQPVDLADGRAEVSAKLKLKLIKGLKTEDIDYQVAGKLRQVRSDKIVKGRSLTADELAVTANPKGLEISGDAALDGVPLTGGWRQAFGPEGKGKSRVEGSLTLSQATLDAFSIALPQGAVTGQGSGRFSIDLRRGAPPAFHLESDLKGLTLKIPEVQWTKTADQAGKLVVAGRFATPAEIDQLDLSGNGLTAAGKVVLKPDGGMDRAEFDQVRLNDWFDGKITLTGRGKGHAVGLSVRSGTADLRQATFGTSSTDPNDVPPIEIALDRLRISEDIGLETFTGTFSATGGMSGTFNGMVNGEAPVTGTMVSDAAGRAAFRIEADDAGAVLAASGLYGSGRGGTMKLILQPAAAKGSYDGTISISDIRVVDAPVLAGLLDAISVVGLIDQLRGAGIIFSDVAGKFLLTPEAVEIREGSAVGPSLGVSAAGVYRTADRSLDLQGVISPVYLLNGIGQIFSHQRDGLFGFNYTLTGTSAATKIAVNPLSILTPGMFRDLFRKAPPTIATPPAP